MKINRAATLCPEKSSVFELSIQNSAALIAVITGGFSHHNRMYVYGKKKEFYQLQSLSCGYKKLDRMEISQLV